MDRYSRSKKERTLLIPQEIMEGTTWKAKIYFNIKGGEGYIVSPKTI